MPHIFKNACSARGNQRNVVARLIVSGQKGTRPPGPPGAARLEVFPRGADGWCAGWTSHISQTSEGVAAAPSADGAMALTLANGETRTMALPPPRRSLFLVKGSRRQAAKCRRLYD